MPFSKSSTWTTVVLSASCQQIMKTLGRIGVITIWTVSEVPAKGPSALVRIMTASDSKRRWWTQLPKLASYTWPTAGKWIVDMGSSFPGACIAVWAWIPLLSHEVSTHDYSPPTHHLKAFREREQGSFVPDDCIPGDAAHQSQGSFVLPDER